ncbi:hypothetical protein [Acetobacter orientalis]|uniref:hypothetical protein n=1 Tax=Acetobacter orientalis TaxID=146474 RepID=UPI00241F3D8A|nr:hypothetical protein [Acetobacter orientalis]
MSDLPELKADEIQLNNKESIAVLAALRKRGYGFEQIVEFLRENDFEITTSTLKTYLRGQNPNSGKEPKNNTKKTKKPTTENKRVSKVTVKNETKRQTKKQTAKEYNNQAEFLIVPDRDAL